MNKVAFKQKKYICYSSGGWEVKHQGSSSFGILWEPSSWLIDSCLLTVSSHGRRSKQAFWGLFYKGTNHIHEDFTYVI